MQNVKWGVKMFRVLTRDGKKLSSLSGNTVMLQQLSKQKHLICPYCKEGMQFVSATQKRPYFRHLTLCTYVYHDSEGEEHDQGKELLAKRLKELFPKSIVELEEGVKETNQISDVMVIHPNGERWAFEFQCYLLTKDQWRTRHNLYKKTGIYDFWVFGDISVHNYAASGKAHHRLKSMENAVWDSGSPLYYLNTETQRFRIIDEGKSYSETVLDALEAEDDFSEAFIKDYQWYSPTRIKLEEARRLELEKLKEKQRLAEEQRKRQQQAWEEEEKRREKERESRFATLITQRDNFMANFTPKEKELFLRLSKKHGYNRDSFPGLLQVEVEHFQLIKTPVQVWQLWLYDAHIYDQVRKRPQNPRINADFIKEGFMKLKNQGVFRVAWNPSSACNYIFALYSYLEVLCRVEVLKKMGFRTAKKYELLVNKIPVYNDRGLNNSKRWSWNMTILRTTLF